MERSINDVISKLKTIKKEQLDERSFYEQVLLALKEIPEDFNNDEANVLKETLLNIGCMPYKEWEKLQIQKVHYSTPDEAEKDGNIATAVSYVQQFLFPIHHLMHREY